MKVNLDLIAKTLNGRVGKLVFYYYPQSDALIARTYVKPRKNKNNSNFSLKTKNLSKFYKNCTDSYKSDIKHYSNRLNNIRVGEGIIYNGYNVFIKMMHNLHKAYPEVDLKTITPEYVVALNLPVITIKMAVENELLPAV